MTQNQPLDRDDVLRRIRAGGVLRLDASYSYQSCFDGGPVVPHQVMSSLAFSGELRRPDVRGGVWALASSPDARGTAAGASTTTAALN